MQLASTGDATFTGNIIALTGAGSGNITVGRNANEKTVIDVGDQVNSITAYQDSDGDATHNFVLNRVFGGTGTNDFIIQKDGTAQFTLDTSANATFAGSVTATSLIKSGGSSSEFLKADGSVDSNTYSPVAGSTSLTTAGVLTVDQLNMRDAGDYITFYGDDAANHSIGARNASGNADDDIRINSYGSVYINLDSNNNNSSVANFLIGRHGGTGAISDWLFKVDGESGNVGIGTTSPSYPLHVLFSGDTGARIESTDNHSSLFIDSHSSKGQYIRFTENNAAQYWIQSFGGKLNFRPAGTGTAANYVSFDATGNVGIGTISPRGKLDIVGNTDDDADFLNNSR
jgi:hypothetical protein